MQKFDDFLNILDTKRMLKHDFRERIRRMLISRTFNKGEWWMGGGVSSVEIPFLNRGAAVGFRQLDGKRHISNLWEKGEVIISGSNIFEENRTKTTHIQFLEPSVAYILNTLDIIKLCNKYLDARFMVQYFLAEALKKVEEHNYRLSGLPPERRLQEVSSRYPNAFGLLSHMEKASFLGISRQTLYNIS